MKKQLLLATAILLTAASSFAQTLNIGGHRATYDSRNRIWLCSIPRFIFGDNYTAEVSYGEDMSNLVIEDLPVANEDMFFFENVEGGKKYAMTVQYGDSTYAGDITFTWLPIVELFGDFNDDEYTYTSVIISEPDSAYAEPMLAKIKTRGIATAMPGKNKLNYRIKFVNEDSTKCNRRFFGLRNDNNWILDAGQVDFLRVRNRVSTDLWLDMARRPWYSDTLPNARNGSRGQMVEVMLNGEYRGIYNMCEPIDRKQLKLKRYDEENEEFHGELWMAYKWTRTVAMTLITKRTDEVFWNGFETKYPDYDEIGRADWTVLENAVNFAYRSDGDSILQVDSMGHYFDLPVMQDYFIFIATLQALDNESKNIYYACHDIADHPRLTMVPWDLDICLGQMYDPAATPNPEAISPTRPFTWVSHLPMVSMWHHRDYHNEVVARYKQLRKGVLDTDSLVNRYRSVINDLEECGAANREEKRWSRNRDLAGKKLDLSAEMDYVEDWIRQRMPYLDEYVFVEMPDDGGGGGDDDELPGDLNLDGEVTVADLNLLINVILYGTNDSGLLKRADVNKDGEINIGDVNAIVDIILS